jgi:DNA-binding NarL/FixJ family response regulator
MHEPVNIIVAEDNEDLRTIMAPLINEYPPLNCAATTDHVDQIEPLIAEHDARVAVVDIQLRGGSVVERLPGLRERFPATRFIIHSGHSNPALIRAAGADAFVVKSGDFDELVRVIRSVLGMS